MTTQIHNALKTHFGFDRFLDNQDEIVQDILNGKDLCVVMPTGAGKSLCFQLPSLIMPGYGLIVSPLISLMKDQVDALRAKNIPAAFINTSIARHEQIAAMDAAAAGLLKLLYVAPERFNSSAFQDFIISCPPSLLVVDEAHCISQWGHDFRPAYLFIGEMVERCALPQVCAFTATATPQVRDDIVKQLRRPQMETVAVGFKRPNLAFSVLECNTNAQKNTAIRRLLKKPAPTIIYASTRKVVEQLAAEFKIIPYHAGMSDEERTSAQDRFMNDECPTLVATNAFGMGIDRADVHRVIHYSIPGTLEAYYQEAGRAGRNGEPAECILLYAYHDRFVQEFLIEMNNPPQDVVMSLYEKLLALSAQTGSNQIEMTLSELANVVPGAKSEKQLSSAMNILEKHGYIGRGYRQQNQGELSFTGDIKSLDEQHSAQNTQRSRFISRCIEHFGTELYNPVKVSYFQLAEVSGLNTEQIQRVVRALNGDCIKWVAPFSGRLTELLRSEEKILEIDFSEASHKRDFEIARLNEVISYAQTKGCRQATLINYFGEHTDGWLCKNCDRCSNSTGALRKANVNETGIIREILDTVSDFSGRLGRTRLALIMAGAERPEIFNYGHDRHAKFGILKKTKQSEIVSLMKNLEDNGFLCRTGNPEYPCLDITPKGLEILNGVSEVKLNLPESHAPKLGKDTKKAESSPNSLPGNDDLFDELRMLRNKMAAERNVPAFGILSNRTLTELAEIRPLTKAEASGIHGVGPVKLDTVIPRMLDAIKKWRAENITK